MNYRLILIALLSCALLALVPAGTAGAQPAIATRFYGDTSLAELVRGAAGTGTLLYYPAGGDAQRPLLAVRLLRAPDQPDATAEVYDAPDGRDYVPVVIADQKVTIQASSVVVLKALGGWWARDGLVNYNLDIDVSGPVHALWNADLGENPWIRAVRPGQPVVHIAVRDPQHTGAPQWDLRQLLPGFAGHSYVRTSYAERKCAGAARAEPGVSPDWPLIGSEQQFEQPAGAWIPPIRVDWSRARITFVSEFVTVRNQGCSYSLYSVSPLKAGQLNQANFETPFAFYDLSGGQSQPNMILRAERYPARDPWSTELDPEVQNGKPAPSDYETVRYSWRDAAGDGRWDYKVDVLGFQPYTDTTSIAGGYATIDAPAYEQLPQWVAGRSWPAVTFVDAAASSYRSSEGIYDWSPRDLGIGYLFGWESAPRAAFDQIRPRLRGEYRYRTSAPPSLYFSPLDRRLHLLGAEGGLWNLGDGLVLRAHSLAGGPYIDGWTRERADTPGGPAEEALYTLAGQVIYAGPRGVEIWRRAIEPAAFTTPPPRDRASWAELHGRLAAAGQPRDPRDLRGWLAELGSPDQAIAGATLTDVRATPGGFRFALALQPGARARGAGLEAFAGLRPGAYAATYNGSFQVEPLTPPAIGVALPALDIQQSQQVGVPIRLTNDGRADLPAATLELWAAPPQGQATLIMSQTVALLAREPITATLRWTPRRSGDWTLSARVLGSDGRLLAQQDGAARVAPAAAPAPAELLLASNPRPELALVALLIGAISLIAALAFRRLLPRPTTTQVEDAS
jgi:hypothetical protein